MNIVDIQVQIDTRGVKRRVRLVQLLAYLMPRRFWTARRVEAISRWCASAAKITVPQ